MKILVIEDNLLKRDKIIEFLNSKYTVKVSEAASYNSGLIAACEQKFDFMVLDMSMPTFDRNETTHGGRFRVLAGKEIISKLNKLDKMLPFVVLTGYKDFSIDSKSLSIDQIHDILSTFGEYYKGCVVFNSADVLWKEELSDIIGALE